MSRGIGKEKVMMGKRSALTREVLRRAVGGKWGLILRKP